MSKGWEVDGGRAGGPVRKGTKSCKGRRRKRERRGGRGKRVPHPPQQPRCAENDDSLRLTARRSDRCQTVVVAAAAAAADEDSADEAPATKMRRNAGSDATTCERRRREGPGKAAVGPRARRRHRRSGGAKGTARRGGVAQDKCCWGGPGGLAGNRPAWPPRSAYGEPAARNRGGAPFTCRKWVLRTGPRKSVLPPPRAERPSEGWYPRGRMQNRMHKTKRKR